MMTCAGHILISGPEARSSFPDAVRLELHFSHGIAQHVLCANADGRAALAAPDWAGAWARLATFTHIRDLRLSGSFGQELSVSRRAGGPRALQRTSSEVDDLDYFFGAGPDREKPIVDEPATSQQIQAEARAVSPPELQSEPGYLAQEGLMRALRALAPSLRALTLENAPLSPMLLDGIAELSHLTQLRLPISIDMSNEALLGHPEAPRHSTFPDMAADCFLARVLVARPRLPLAALPRLRELCVSYQLGVNGGSLAQLEHASCLTLLDLSGCRHVMLADVAKARVHTPMCMRISSARQSLLPFPAFVCLVAQTHSAGKAALSSIWTGAAISAQIIASSLPKQTYADSAEHATDGERYVCGGTQPANAATH